RGRVVSARPLSRTAGDAGCPDRRGDGADRGGGGSVRGGESRPARALRRDRRHPLQADRRAGRRTGARMHTRTGPRPGRQGQSSRDCRRPVGGARNADLCGGAMIGRANGAISITGIGGYAPARGGTNDDLSGMMETSDEWIVERTGIRERRIAGDEQALSDLALPAAREALAHAGVGGADVDLLIVATVTPDMAFPSAAAILADELGAGEAGAYDLSAGCTGFMYAIAQAYGMLAAGLAHRALVVGGDVLSRILAWSARRPAVSFGRRA